MRNRRGAFDMFLFLYIVYARQFCLVFLSLFFCLAQTCASQEQPWHEAAVENGELDPHVFSEYDDQQTRDRSVRRKKQSRWARALKTVVVLGCGAALYALWLWWHRPELCAVGTQTEAAPAEETPVPIALKIAVQLPVATPVPVPLKSDAAVGGDTPIFALKVQELARTVPVKKAAEQAKKEHDQHVQAPRALPVPRGPVRVEARKLVEKTVERATVLGELAAAKMQEQRVASLKYSDRQEQNDSSRSDERGTGKMEGMLREGVKEIGVALAKEAMREAREGVVKGVRKIAGV